MSNETKMSAPVDVLAVPVWQVCYRTATGGYYWGFHVCQTADNARTEAMRNGVTPGNGYEIWAVLPVEGEQADKARAALARVGGGK